MKNTKQRTMILDVLKRAKKPISAHDIYERIQENDTQIALTTIYRNLDALYENDLITRSRLDDNEYSYELKKENHTHYLICKNCKEKIDLPGCPLHDLEKSILDSTGFEVTSHNLELEGYCKKCKK